MPSKFKIFNLNKILKEMYEKYYVPYCLNEATTGPNLSWSGGGKSRVVTKKGKPIEPDEEDYEFISSVVTQTGISASKALMARYHLLGAHDEVLKNPELPKDEKNNAAIKIEKGPEDSDGNISVKISVRGAGRYANIKTAVIKTNIKHLREKVHKYGYTTEESLRSIFRTPMRTWEGYVKIDKTAPKGAANSFVVKSIPFDYHARQEATNSTFSDKFQNETEFRNEIIEMAVKAARSATGLNVRHVRGELNVTAKSKTGFNGVSQSDFEDVMQAAIIHLSNETAHNPEKLDISDENNFQWVKKKLQVGAQNHMRDFLASAGDRGSARAYSGSVMSQSKDGSETRTDVDADVNKRRLGIDDETPDLDNETGNIDHLKDHLKMIRDKIKQYPVFSQNDENDESSPHHEQAKKRRRLINIAIGLEDQIETLTKQPKSGEFSRFASKIKSPLVAPIAGPPKTDLTMKEKPGVTSIGYHDDELASPEDLNKYRRRFMNSETFSFRDFFKIKEVAGASGPAIYNTQKKKNKDFQWEGSPESMFKKK